MMAALILLVLAAMPLDGYELGIIAAGAADLATTEHAAHFVATHEGWSGYEANPFGQTSVNRAVVKVLATTAVVLCYREIRKHSPKAARWFAISVMAAWSLVSVHTLNEVHTWW